MKALTSVIFKNDKRRELSSRNGKASGFLALLSFIIVFGSLAIAMIIASIYITKRLREFWQTFAFINFMLLGNFGVLFAESIFQAINILYFSKDLKILLRMPIKSKDIIHAKLLKMIMSEYEMETIMLAIPMIVYGLMTHMGFQYYLYIPLILLILPVIPVCITSIITAIIMRFTNLIKNKSKVVYITLILAILLVDVVMMFFGHSGARENFFDEQVIIRENSWANIIADDFKLIKPIMNSLLHYNSIEGIKNMAMYFLGSVVVYIVTVHFIALIYLKGAIGTIINSDRNLSKDEVKLTINDFKRRSYRGSYLLKELWLIQRSPIFFIQCLLLPVVFTLILLFIVIGLIAASQVIGFDMMADIMARARTSGGTSLFLSVSQVLYMINFTSIIAVSKEERWAVLSKYLPIKLSNQIDMKLFIGEFTNFISSLIVAVFYYVCTLQVIHTIILLAIIIVLNLIGEKVKILIDLKNPKTDWDNEYTMMKQNTNVMYVLFYTLIVMGIFSGMSFIITNLTAYLIVNAIIVLSINVTFNKYIFNNDKKIFESLF